MSFYEIEMKFFTVVLSIVTSKVLARRKTRHEYQKGKKNLKLIYFYICF